MSRAALHGQHKCLSVGGFHSWISHSTHSAGQRAAGTEGGLSSLWKTPRDAQGKRKLLENTDYVKANQFGFTEFPE